MSSEGLITKKVDENELDKDTPLSDEEISRLIQASRETSFKRKEIKKEMSEAFKKVSLHDIAKKYGKDLLSKQEQYKKEEKDNSSNINTDTKETNLNKEKPESIEKEDNSEIQNNEEIDKPASKEEENIKEEKIKTFWFLLI